MVAGVPRRDEVWLVDLEPTRGAEIRKTRPCLVVSADELNENLQAVIVAPMTTTIRPYPTRVSLRFQGRNGQIALDQLRAIARIRLLRKLGTVTSHTAQLAAATLIEMFSRT